MRHSPEVTLITTYCNKQKGVSLILPQWKGHRKKHCSQPHHCWEQATRATIVLDCQRGHRTCGRTFAPVLPHSKGSVLLVRNHIDVGKLFSSVSTGTTYQYCLTAKEMSPEMCCSYMPHGPSLPEESCTSAPDAALSQGNISPPAGGLATNDGGHHLVRECGCVG